MKASQIVAIVLGISVNGLYGADSPFRKTNILEMYIPEKMCLPGTAFSSVNEDIQEIIGNEVPKTMCFVPFFLKSQGENVTYHHTRTDLPSQMAVMEVLVAVRYHPEIVERRKYSYNGLIRIGYLSPAEWALWQQIKSQ